MNVRLALMSAGIMGADHACIFAAEKPGATLRFICDAYQFRPPFDFGLFCSRRTSALRKAAVVGLMLVSGGAQC
jgi:hypothetical protein